MSAPSLSGIALRGAKVISDVLHPYVALSIVIVYIAYALSPSNRLWATWAVVTIVATYVFPIGYMKIKALLVSRQGNVRVAGRDYFRERPNEMLILASLFGIPGSVILYFLDFPHGIISIILAIGV